jgi:hypothetical protein
VKLTDEEREEVRRYLRRGLPLEAVKYLKDQARRFGASLSLREAKAWSRGRDRDEETFPSLSQFQPTRRTIRE